jgi:hypothetical protein
MGTGYHIFHKNGDDDSWRNHIVGNPKDTAVQIVLSTVVGLAAFLGFCVSYYPLLKHACCV